MLMNQTTTNPSTTSLAEITDVYEREGLLGIQSLLSRKEEEVLERNDDYQSGFDAGYEAAKKEWKSY